MGLLYVTFPKYIGYANDEYKSVVSLAKTGRDIEGNEDYRFAGTGDVLLMKKLIKEHLFFGVGFTRYSYEDLSNFRDEDNPLAGLYAGGELPYLGSTGKMGIMGLLLFSPMYFLIIQMSLKLYRVIKKNVINVFIQQNSYELILAVIALTFTITRFTFSLFNIFVETYNAPSLLGYVINLTILIVCYNKLNKTQEIQNLGLQNNQIIVIR